MQNFQSDPFAFLESHRDQDLDGQHPIQGMLSLLKKSVWPASGPKEQQFDDDNKDLSSDQLIAKYELQKKKGETLFILPEYQQFKHICRKLDPRFVDNLHDGNLKACGEYLHRAYKQCLHRLENVNNGEQVQDYNLILTKRWMMIVVRKQGSYNDIHCNSLGYVGLLFVKSEEKKEELIRRIQPINLLVSLAVPAFGVEVNQ